MKTRASKTLIDALGMEAIMARLGVSWYSVDRAKRGGIPASWYMAVNDMCADRAIDCPADAFNFKAPAE